MILDFWQIKLNFLEKFVDLVSIPRGEMEMNQFVLPKVNYLSISIFVGRVLGTG